MKGYYWTVHPKPNACDKCKAMAGLKYISEPERPHPNCKCEIKKHYIGVNIMGVLDGYGSRETHSFSTGQKIVVEVKNLGPFLSGAQVQVDGDVWRDTGHMYPGQSRSFEFTKFGEIPLPWVVMLMYGGADNSSVQYFIRG
ncbi:hypothetical protein GM415_03480 [Pseudodesulfovibrio cashew]|uniref:Uncharacterized protein n=1 Tax=Pseudodesulfovibrio cashew TaxID=2678688 RepID=A0A6I6JAX6_9BACT|nr:hypothetical protein [Pseudodesulfovibrio cashew]QGY39221.1 hypothetical protein GM415_03480 [Pseudodesulfovibrio cashew]